MRKLFILLILFLVINKAVAGTSFSNDEYFLFYIPASILIIWWIAKIIRKNYLKYKAQISVTDIDQESDASKLKSQTNEIAEIFKEKDILGLDKPASILEDNTLSDTKAATSNSNGVNFHNF